MVYNAVNDEKRKHAFDAILHSIKQTYIPEEIPCLLDQCERWQQSQPFAGKKIFDATPLFHNTLSKYLPLLAGGAELTIGIHDRFNYDPQIADFLKQIGVPVLFNSFTGFEQDIVLDCAAVHSQKKPKLGFVELTRSGEHLFAKSAKPCISVDRSVIKYFEDSLGTADGLMRALEKLNISVKEKKIVLFGYGKVGSGIAHRLLQENAKLTVIEDTGKMQSEPMQFIDFRKKELVEAEAERADLIITATGVPGIICRHYDSKKITDSSALLINMGAEDEFGECVSANRALNQKFPLNFMLPEPTRLRYLDATFALHNECALMLLENAALAPGLHSPKKETESRLIRISLEKSIVREEEAAFLNRHDHKSKKETENDV